MPELSLVITVFNEEENIRPLLAKIREDLGTADYEVVLVDDGSTDKTVAQIREHMDDRVLLVELRKNYGQSTAMMAGIDHTSGKYVALLDGDLQNDPKDIPRLLEEISRGADLVCGYRAKRRDTVVKKITSRVANFVRSRFVGDGVRDTGCTLKAMRRECAAALVPFKGVHRFIPALVKNAGYRIVEIPVNHRARQYGVSKYGLGNRAIKATTDMLGVRWLQSRHIDYRVKQG